MLPRAYHFGLSDFVWLIQNYDFVNFKNKMIGIEITLSINMQTGSGWWKNN